MINLVHQNCLDFMKSNLLNQSIDCVITSPPYNRNIKYGKYKDSLNENEYITFMENIFIEIKRILKDNGNFFLNLGSSCKNPWFSYDIAQIARKHFTLQNKINWIHSISVKDIGHGHYTPINSKYYLNNTFEDLFHFVKKDFNEIDRESIGIKYSDASNIFRWKKKKNKRCIGNCWYIPYETIRLKMEKGNHPAIFPEKLVENIINLCKLNSEHVVYDPFSGTGTTAVVCKKNKVSAIATDIDEDYINFTKKRLENII